MVTRKLNHLPISFKLVHITMEGVGPHMFFCNHHQAMLSDTHILKEPFADHHYGLSRAHVMKSVWSAVNAACFCRHEHTKDCHIISINLSSSHTVSQLVFRVFLLLRKNLMSERHTDFLLRTITRGKLINYFSMTYQCAWCIISRADKRKLFASILRSNALSLHF